MFRLVKSFSSRLGHRFSRPRSWIIDGRSIAKKVIGATVSSAKQIKDCGAKRQCPNCHYMIDNSDVSCEWPGLPAGVKFDPSDVELLDHLATKCGVGNAKPHMFIDEFIPTLNAEKGICYTHPKGLPGAKKDGISTHFFHKTTNAYSSGQRKRRKIHNEQSGDTIRWHKTGKTKPVIENGIQKGCKKIMVLYRCSKTGSKPVKSNWVMHQYHLGTDDDEREGEYVVSKITYQKPKEAEKNGCNEEQLPLVMNPTGPNTPGTITPNPPRPGSSLMCDEPDGLSPHSVVQDLEPIIEVSHSTPLVQPKEDTIHNVCPAGESQAIDLDGSGLYDPLLCREIFGSCDPLINGAEHGITDAFEGGTNGTYGLTDLDGLDFDTPPDISLNDLDFGSQDSVFGWLDRL